MDFKERIKELRTEKCVSQSDIAKLLHMSKMAISHWEKGNSEPCIEQLKILARYFEVTIDYLVGFAD